MRSRPEYVAQVKAVTGTETTFTEMTEKSVKCALWLREQAVQPGDIIGICTHNHLESYIPLLAALYVGAISNPWDNELSPNCSRRVITPDYEDDDDEICKFIGEYEATELDITDLVEQNMPWYCRLHAGVKFMQRLPRTATGKIAKKELKQIAKNYAANDRIEITSRLLPYPKHRLRHL
ncbi:hypothetical protein PUN28_016768 [Cardiocondyla obscurior]|uniref:AMP-dependent synthetase/ligase domain-containing protein n=1 Tax=Cardiocondyla obscurior TaxID=286306 RepID=A0AAW2ER07_9HYME